MVRKRGKKSGILAIVALFLWTSMGVSFASLLEGYKETVLVEEPIGSGITYAEKALQSQDGRLQRVNIVTADMSNENVEILTSKPKDVGVKVEPLSMQIARERFKGKNVVAGINADMFDMYLGDSIGLQVKEGRIVTGPLNTDYDMFGIGESGEPFIQNVRTTASFAVVDAVYEEVYGVPNPSLTLPLDGVNRSVNAYNDGLLLLTPAYNESGVVNTSKQGALTVIRGITDPIRLGQSYEGVVESVGAGVTSAPIPADGVILASTGTKGKWISSHLKEGDRVRFTLDSNRNDMREGVSAYIPLVADGAALTYDQMKAAGANEAMITSLKPRTAIGLTADRKVIAVTVDGGQPSYGISDGVSLTQMAEIMTKAGAVQALSLDGGGSTEMAVKRFGQNEVSVVNRPSDGYERSVTNGILFASKAEPSGEVGQVKVDRDVVLYKGSTFSFSARAMDTSGHPIDLGLRNVAWRADEAVGTIDQTGLFTSGESAGQGMVSAIVDGVMGSALVKVVDEVYTLSLTDSGDVTVDLGKTKQFSITAATAEGEPIIIDHGAALWSVTGEIGTIDENGLFTASARPGTGEVSATLRDKRVSIKVIVGQTAKVMDDFEHNDEARYKPISGYVGGHGQISSEQAKSGRYSFKISYDYDEYWTRKYNGTINFIPTFTDRDGNNIAGQYTTTIRPKKFGMWVYGDGHAPWLRIRLKDGEGQIRTYDMVSRINWIGWKYVDVTIPSDVPLPISLDYIYMVETNKALHYKGTVYFDDIRYVYSEEEDLSSPQFSNFQPSSSTVYTKDLPISLDITDNKSGVDLHSIQMSLDGERVDFDVAEEEGVVTVTYTAHDLYEGKHVVRVEAADKAGNAANPPFSREFQVNLQPDLTPPAISNLLPLNGSTIPTPTPRISVKITDAQAGVDVKDIDFELDGEKQIPTYDGSTGIAYLIPEPLSDGPHTVRVHAKDRAGNAAERLVPARGLANDLGADLTYDGATNRITFSKGETAVIFTYDAAEAQVNGETVRLPLPAKNVNGTSYIPLGFMKKYFSFSDELQAKYPDGVTASFTVKAIGQPKDGEHFQISLTSDSHATGYAPYFFRMIEADDSELVLQNGDLVDNDLPEQWAAAAEQLKLISKPILFSPGNHEAFKGSLTNYMNTYGLPPYTLAYGNTLLISLNSAQGQSISYSDPSQFDYLRKVLEKNEKSNVILFTHNPTRDTFGTKHEMNPGDAAELEGILGDYKKNHPDKSVTVLFGHLHTIQGWEVEGVQYVINGDEAGKKYVAPEKGGLLAYTKIYVDGNQVNYAFVPLVKQISVVDDANRNGVLKIAEGASRSLDLKGDFSILSSDYILSLGQFPHMEMKWSSSDEGVVSVDQRGRITAQKAGTAQLTAEVAGKRYSLTVESIPKAEIKPIKLGISPERTEVMKESIDFQLTAYDLYGNAFALDPKDAEWSVTNNIGKVENGRFTPIPQEKRTQGEVIATYKDFTVKAMVTVKESLIPKTIEVTPAQFELAEGSSKRLTAVAKDQNGLPIYDLAVKWSSDDEGIAVVDQTGLVTAVGRGKTSIRASIANLTGVSEVTVSQSISPPGGGSGGNERPPVVPPTTPPAKGPVTLKIKPEWVSQQLKDGTKKEVMIPIDEETLAEGSSVLLQFTEETIAQIAGSGKPVIIETSKGSLTFSAEMMKWAAQNKRLSVNLSFTSGKENEVRIAAIRSAKVISDILNLQIEGWKGELPVTITLPIDKAGAADPLKLALYRQENGSWRYLGGFADEGKGSLSYQVKENGSYAVIAPEVSWPDIEGHWAKESIERMASRQVMKGMNENSFNPEGKLTRAQFASLLVRLFGLTGEGEIPFQDVSQADWYFREVRIAYENGIVNGTSLKTFSPNEEVTRQDMVVMLVRAMERAKMELTLPAEAASFTDGNKIAHYATEAIRRAKTNGLVTGYPDGSFRPLAVSKRAEAAILLDQVLHRLATEFTK